MFILIFIFLLVIILVALYFCGKAVQQDFKHIEYRAFKVEQSFRNGIEADKINLENDWNNLCNDYEVVCSDLNKTIERHIKKNPWEEPLKVREGVSKSYVKALENMGASKEFIKKLKRTSKFNLK